MNLINLNIISKPKNYKCEREESNHHLLPSIFPGMIRKELRAWLVSAVFLFLSFQAPAQSIIDIIDNTSNATFTLTAYSEDQIPLDTVRAFFISADGLAITRASILQNADTIIISGNRNRNLEVSRVLAIHQWANLALIQVSGYRRRDGNYLIPHRSNFSVPGEILIFGYPQETDDGLTYGETTRSIHSRKLGRGSLLSVNPGSTSNGSPIINQEGRLIGIYQSLRSVGAGTMISAQSINDEKWTSINLPWYQFKHHMHKKKLTSSLPFMALMLQDLEMWLESARLYTAAIREIPDHPELLSFRSLSRYNYGNYMGGNDDFSYALQLNTESALPYLARAHHHLRINDHRNAFKDLITGSEKENAPPEVFYLLGKIQSNQHEIRKAHASFTFVIQADSLYDKAWYERGRLLMLHASDKDRALNDLLIAARLNPDLPGIFTLIGSIRLDQMDYLEAINDFNRALRNNPTDIHALMNRGTAYYNTGLKERACEDWDTAGRLGNTEAFKLISRHCSQLRRSRFTTYD